MQMGKAKNAASPPKKGAANRVKFLTQHSQMAIPIGYRFQADVPEWTGMPNKNYFSQGGGDTSRWLGTRSWPIGGSSSSTQSDADKIGKGRPDSCPCASPGSVQCVKLHIQEKSAELQQELGPSFGDWNFHTMGEEAVLRLWTLREQRRFESLVEKHKSFLKPIMKAFPSKSREDIVSYFWNVIVTRRMSKRTRSGGSGKTIDSDDSDDGEPSTTTDSNTPRKRKTIDSDDDEPSTTTFSNTPRKRTQTDSSTSPNSKQEKAPFLRGHR